MTVQGLLGLKHVKTMEIHTHVLNRSAGGGWASPLESRRYPVLTDWGIDQEYGAM